MTDKTMTLEPCPFCGCKDNLGRVYSGTHSEYYVQCFDCDARGPVYADDNDACGAWSNRHLSQPSERGEAQEKAEPVAWMMTCGGYKRPVEFYAEKPTFVPAISEIVPLYTAPPPAAGVPDGWRLIAVNEYFGDLMYWVERSVDNGHAPDIDESWNGFSWREMPAAPSPTIDVAAVRRVHELLEIECEHELADKLARARGQQP